MTRRAASRGSELRAGRHLNLPRAANSLVDVAQSKGAIVKAASLVLGAAGGRQRCGSLRRKSVVILILVDAVNGDVKAGRVGDVETVEAKLQRRALRQPGGFNQRDVQALLPRLPENIALSGGGGHYADARDLCCMTMCYFDET